MNASLFILKSSSNTGIILSRRLCFVGWMMLILLTGTNAALHAQQQQPAKVNSREQDEAAIRNLLLRQRDDWNSGSTSDFMKGYWDNDSLVFIGSSLTKGYRNTLERYKKNYPDTASMGKLAFEFVEFRRLSDEYYFVIGKWHLTRSKGDAGGMYTLLFRKIKGEWVIVADHSS